MVAWGFTVAPVEVFQEEDAEQRSTVDRKEIILTFKKAESIV